MAEHAFIYDAIRTPRSKGKQDGTLHEVKPINLVTTLLNEMQARHDLDTARVDDVVMGCVAPVLEQGSCIAKAAAQSAGWDESVPGVQLDRFCASGLEAVNLGAALARLGRRVVVVDMDPQANASQNLGAELAHLELHDP